VSPSTHIANLSSTAGNRQGAMWHNYRPLCNFRFPVVMSSDVWSLNIMSCTVRAAPPNVDSTSRMNPLDMNRRNRSVRPGINPPLPADLSFLGPPPLSRGQPDQDTFLPQQLRGPGSAGLPLPSLSDRPLPAASRKRTRTISPEPAVTGGYGPISDGGFDGGADRTKLVSPHAVKLAGRKNTAHDIWAFVRAVETNETIPQEDWPNDYNRYLVKRPSSSFIGCKLCTQFG